VKEKQKRKRQFEKVWFILTKEFDFHTNDFLFFLIIILLFLLISFTA
jgi:hypothetical protein